MMARIGSVGPEAFSRSDRISNGLSSVMRDHMALNPSRVDMLLGLASQSQSSSPIHDSNELNEEDIWGAVPDARNLPEESNNTTNIATSPVADVKKYDMGFVGGSSSVSKEVLEADPFRFMNNGRRWLSRDKDSGLSMAYVDAGRPRGFPSPLNRGGATANGTFTTTVNGASGRTSSRLIPSRDALYSSPSNRVLHQSAPVNVPDWSKILGAERKSFKEFVDDDIVPENDEDEERLPPHELIAREYARSQVTTFSMCEGAGRTLKGRDQSRVRNAVLKQTGFLNDQ